MEQRQGNIIIHASGGTSGKGAQTYKLALPSSWAKQIGITGQERSVELSFDGTAITIRKRLNMDEFLTQKHGGTHASETVILQRRYTLHHDPCRSKRSDALL